MNWIGISGSWRRQTTKMERDVKSLVSEIIASGDGIVVGGALGVDYIATNTVIKLNPGLSQLKIFLPTSLDDYNKHYHTRASEGIITKQQADLLEEQLKAVARINPQAIFENARTKAVSRQSYYARNKKIVENSDELIAFQVNKSQGTQNAIDQAIKQNKQVKLFSYTTG